MNRTALRQPGARDRRRPAFTLVELLVVVVVIGILISIVVLVGPAVLSGQKAATTENTIRTVTLAIEQFATEDPLQNIYNNPRLRVQNFQLGRTFGPYPPYQLGGFADNDADLSESVHEALEQAHPLMAADGSPIRPAFLADRVAFDLSGISVGAPNTHEWARLHSDPRRPGASIGGEELHRQRQYDDIRSLYAYMAAFSPGLLQQIPDSAIAPLRENDQLGEYVNPQGIGDEPGTAGSNWVDVLGFHDAWGVPLDYYLHVKLEWKVPAAGGPPQWVATERVPVIRSRGVEAEVFEQRGDSPETWIASEALPQPWFARDLVNQQTGRLSDPSLARDYTGWVQAVAAFHQDDTPGPGSRDTYIPPEPPQ